MNASVQTHSALSTRQTLCSTPIAPKFLEIGNGFTALSFKHSSYEEIMDSDVIKDAVKNAIEEKNADLPRYEQIKKFRIVPHDFSQETGELTPTMKVKRKVVNEKFAGLIENMYASKE